MPLIDQVQQDMVAAMKSRDEARLSALRMIKAALMKAKVDSPRPLDDVAEMQILKSLIKQRIDAAEMFHKAGRTEQAQKEEAERNLIESYLPSAATGQEIEAAIAEALAETGATALKQMGVALAHIPGLLADERLINLHLPARLVEGTRLHGVADSMSHESCRPLGEAKGPMQFHRTDAVAGTGEQPNGGKPFPISGHSRIAVNK